MHFQIFLMTAHLFLFIHDVPYAHIRQHKNLVLHKKLLCQTKQIFHIEVNVAQQNYVRQKNMLWQQKKIM